MRLKFFLVLLLVGFAFWFYEPTYSRVFIDLSVCNQLFGKVGDCRNLHGPVRTAELWASNPLNPESAAQDSEQIHTILFYSRDGRLIKREERQKGALQVRRETKYVDAGTIMVYTTALAENGQMQSGEAVLKLNKQGKVISEKSRPQGGRFVALAQNEYDADGHEISATSCVREDGDCRRTEWEYDPQGKLKLTRAFDPKSEHVWLRQEYEYPGERRRRESDFGGSCFDPKIPATVPNYVIETLFDDAGRVIEETTTSPALTWEVEHAGPSGGIAGPCSEGSPDPGHVVNRYDDHGRLVERESEFYGLSGQITQRQSIYIEYDRFGNEVKRKETEIRPNCRTNTCGESESTEVTEYDYKYDRFGNWTSNASYKLDELGHRERPYSISHQKLDYYSQSAESR